MGGVGAAIASKIHLRVAPADGLRQRFLLGPEVLQGGSELSQSAAINACWTATPRRWPVLHDTLEEGGGEFQAMRRSRSLEK